MQNHVTIPIKPIKTNKKLIFAVTVPIKPIFKGFGTESRASRLTIWGGLTIRNENVEMSLAKPIFSPIS